MVNLNNIEHSFIYFSYLYLFFWNMSVQKVYTSQSIFELLYACAQGSLEVVGGLSKQRTIFSFE